MSGTYPIFKDTEFNLKIHAKQEFRDYKNNDYIDIDFDKKFNEICNADFELTNHQFFVKNYLSQNTPYNSLLLYHGLGTGKTCSAINICEEIRKIYKRIAYNKRIIIIASPNVQDNFKGQLFDSSKLKKENDIWRLNNTCIGNIILDEIFPKQNNNLSKEIVINSVTKFINNHYLFMGYIEFANYIKKLEDRNKSLRKEFENRLIVIDEIHNMKTTCEKKDTQCTYYFKKLVDNVKYMKLVFLTATPMFNSYNEIFELINIMRSNDNLEKINENDILDKNGTFIVDSDTGEEVGLNRFIEYTRGYISYVRGENPYSFPFRIWPTLHSPDKSLFEINPYPIYSPNKELIPENEKIKYLDLYINTLTRDSFQYTAYEFLKNIHKSNDISTPYIMNAMNQILNFAYPNSIDNEDFNKETSLYGKEGLTRLMNYNEIKNVGANNDQSMRIVQYSYKQSTLTDYGKIFNQNIIGKYSHKLKNISQKIIDSEGIILIYSQYIEGGLIPTALMLEELGLNRYDGDNLLKTSEKITKLSHKYIIISGDKRFSPNNDKAVSVCSNTDNMDGSVVKVILISKAASEGIDFKYIRQVHILDPWYNLYRNEQIVGRAIRMCSHKGIPFVKRNVSIFFHATYLNPNDESSDLYMYRLSEQKAIQISKISRIIKRNAVDCMLNSNQTIFTEDNFNKKIKIILSNNNHVTFNVGDKPYTLFCDFDRNCSYDCINNKHVNSSHKPLEQDISTYNFTFLENNIDIIIEKIIRYFANNTPVTTFNHLEDVLKKYPTKRIRYAIDKIVNSELILYDIYDREGTLTILENYILFNPRNLYNKSSLFDRLHPSHNKHSKIPFQYKLNFSSNDFLEELLQNINNTLNTIFNETTFDLKNAISNNNWNHLANYFIKQLNDPDQIIKFSIYGHILDELDLNAKLKIMNFVYDTELQSEYNQIIGKKYIIELKQFIDLKSFTFQDTKAIIIQHENKSIYVLHDNKWNPATFNETKIYHKLFKTYNENDLSSLNKQENTIGFIQENNKTYVFKLKNMLNKKNTGFRCTQAKLLIITDICMELIALLKNMNLLDIDENIITNIIKKKNEDKTFLYCVLLEILLRYSQLKNINNIYWFIDTFNHFTIPLYMKFIKTLKE